MGQCRKRIIEIDPNRHTSDRELRATLLHEMAHAASGCGHTVPFFAQLEWLIRRGAPVTVSDAEVGQAYILADIVPREFPLLRAKIRRIENRRTRRLEKRVHEKGLETYNLTDYMIVMEFRDAAMELTWKQALVCVGLRDGITDEAGRPVNAWARASVT